jgi:uncharacterized protein YjbJ (UPF0337 family)
MNWAEIEGGWEQMKALLKSNWPRLTEADIGRIGGSRDRLVEVLRDRYGLGAEEAEGAVCAFQKEIRRPGAVK